VRHATPPIMNLPSGKKAFSGGARVYRNKSKSSFKKIIFRIFVFNKKSLFLKSCRFQENLDILSNV